MSVEVTRVDVLGVPITPCTLDEAVDRVAAWIATDKRAFATFTGVHGVMEAQRDPNVLRAHRAAAMVACDGAPMVWASRWAGVEIADRVPGRDFMLACSARAEIEGWSSFFYGGKPGIADRLAETLQGQFSALRIVGTLAPTFEALTAREDQQVIDRINASNADLVWVGLSTPKQELWMADHRDRLHAAALFGVGAAFDYLVGDLREAPRWMQRARPRMVVSDDPGAQATGEAVSAKQPGVPPRHRSPPSQAPSRVRPRCRRAPRLLGP